MGERARRPRSREVAEETGAHGRSLGKLGDVRYWFNWEGERVFKVVSFFLVRYEGGRLGDVRPSTATRSRRCSGCRSTDAPQLLAYSGERDDGPTRPLASAYDRRAVPAFALNFYSPIVEAQLKVAPQDGDDPARRQVAQVPEGDDRLGARAAPASARASTSSTR